MNTEKKLRIAPEADDLGSSTTSRATFQDRGNNCRQWSIALMMALVERKGLSGSKAALHPIRPAETLPTQRASPNPRISNDMTPDSIKGPKYSTGLEVFGAS